MATIIVQTAAGSTVVTQPERPRLTVQMGTTRTLNYTKTVKNVTNDDDAEIGDQFRFIVLDASISPVTYTIDPSSFTGLTLNIRSKDSTQGVNVEAASGTIELKNGDDQTILDLLTRETINLYSDGTNLIEV